MNIAAYCRVSTDKSDQRNSLSAQKEFFAKYIAKTGHRLVCLYADEGISGTKVKNRTEFLRMMADAELGRFEMLVVKDISRFARNTVDLLQSLRRLKALGIETLFLTGNRTVLGNSEFILTIFGAMAQEESANASKRIQFGKQINAQKGRVPNLVYGYDKTPGDYLNLTINEREAAVVRTIYTLYTQERLGMSAIAKRLNGENIPTKRGCQWTEKGISRILQNELYIGTVINSKEEVADFLTGRRTTKAPSEWHVVANPSLQIIDSSLYDAAQRIRLAHGAAYKTNTTRQRNKHLFSTLIKCRECGWSFRRIVGKGKDRPVWWACSRHNQDGDACSNTIFLDEAELLQTLQTYFATLLSRKKNAVQAVIRTYQKQWEAAEPALQQEKSLTAHLAKLTDTRQKYLDMYTDDLISRTELEEALKRINEERAQTQHSLSLAAEQSISREDLSRVLNQTIQGVSDIADLRQMTNAQLKQIIQKIEVAPDGSADIFLQPQPKKTV